MGKGHLPIKTVTNMWVSLGTVIWMVRVFTPLRMETLTKESGKMT